MCFPIVNFYFWIFVTLSSVITFEDISYIFIYYLFFVELFAHSYHVINQL